MLKIRDNVDLKELEPNMYVRTKYGEIAKIDEHLGKDSGYKNMEHYETDRMVTKFNNFILYKEDILKASHNIIDLIQSKDLIVDTKNNLYVVDRVEGDYVFTTSKNEYGLIITLVDYQIKSIVTKELFETVSYKVGD